MIAIRNLLLFSCLVVLCGCAEYPHVGHPCPPPGGPSGGIRSCWYLLEIVSIDPNTKIVTGDYVGDEVKNFQTKRFTFRVRDIEMLERTGQLQAGNSYVFASVSNSPYLELYADQISAKQMERDAR